ncbi:MAG: ACP S-malonyltransferase [bacterium]
MKTIFLFPGQGSQFVGMAESVCKAVPEAKARFDEARDYLGFDILKLCVQGPEDDLKNTANTQPAIYIHSFIMAELLITRGYKPDIMAGHSVGEYAAVASAGGFSFIQGLKLVRARGLAMASAGRKVPGTMAAVIGASPELVNEVCFKVSKENIVVPANFNSSKQIVISGSIEGINRACEELKTSGAKRAIILQVSGAFHSPLMKEAVADFQQILEDTQISDIKIPVISNVTAQPVNNGNEIKNLLLKQLTNPVKWVDSMEKAASLGIKKAVETGPGKVLTGLMRDITREIKCFPAGDEKDIDGIVQECDQNSAG